MKPINFLLYIYLLSFINSSPVRRLENSLTFDDSHWSYDQDNNVYYQINVTYCGDPQNITYETLGIYVPGEYMTCIELTSTSKYACKTNSTGTKGSYTATNAPFVMPVQTSGYSAMEAPTSYDYDTVSSFIEKGIIYIYAGCRGRYEGTETTNNYYMGAPWGVTDLKAAIRFLRYNANSLPGNLNSFYTFGHSGGGAQSCLMGVTGNSDLFKEYLENISAAMNYKNETEIKDNIKGSQCWCPITNLDTADAAYEWNMGQYFSTGTRANGTFTKALSDDLVLEYVKYVNNITLKDPKGNILNLTNTNNGTYYDYLKSVIEESLNNFIRDTTFPYTPSSSTNNDPSDNHTQQPSENQGQSSPGGGAPPSSGSNPPPSTIRNLASNETYETAQDYIDSLNSDYQWITKNNSTGNYTITNISDFVIHCKNPTKDVGAFDDLNRTQAENKLFGVNYTINATHFDEIMARLLKDNNSTYSNLSNWNNSYYENYINDLSLNDSLGKNISERVNMYNPMYYIHPYYKGYNTSNVADYFRINSGIAQGNTSNVVEMNLFLVLTNLRKNVKFTTVWDQGHTEAERKGNAIDNFISWIAEIEGVSNSTNSTKNSDYDYSSYQATYINTNLNGTTATSNTSGTSAIYITNDGINITNSNITKSGDIANNLTEDSDFYGINAAILVQGGGLNMTGGNINTSARGGNALVATNGGNVIISNTNIISTGNSSARGLHATYGGNITANNVTISSTGSSCATLATDRGEGTVSCSNCSLSTSGSGSPLIYSTGNITVINTTGTASKAQAVVVEGKNSAIIKSSNLKCTASPNNNNNDGCGAFIYQSQSGDAEDGTGLFTCEKSTLEILNSNSNNYYNISPMFYVTNTDASINLTECLFNYGSNKFIVIDEGNWGKNGSNGGNVNLTLKNQTIIGDIIVGNSSTLNIELINSTIKGTINGNKTASVLSITIDENSKINLTGNSYYTYLNNSIKNDSNIHKGNYVWGNYSSTSETDTTKETDTTIEENINATASVTLLGFSGYNETNRTHFSFLIYFIRVLNSFYSKKLRFPLNVHYKSSLRALQSERIYTDCSLVSSGTNTTIKYSCDATVADTSSISNIEVVPEFIFSSQNNVTLAGISPLAYKYINNLQNVKNELESIDGSYVLDNTKYNKISQNSFNISGIIDDEAPFDENDDLILNVYKKNDLSDIKKVICSITDKNNINYTLNCQQTEVFEPNVSNAYAIKGNDILLVNYKSSDSEEISGTNSTVFFNKEKSGISAGGIVAIILCTIAAIAAVFGVLYFLKGKAPAPKKPEVIESAEHISRTQAVSETNLN